MKNRRYIFIIYENSLEYENRKNENFREIKVSRLSKHTHNNVTDLISLKFSILESLRSQKAQIGSKIENWDKIQDFLNP